MPAVNKTVKSYQQASNRFNVRRKVPGGRLAEDGVLGPLTHRRAIRDERCMGFVASYATGAITTRLIGHLNHDLSTFTRTQRLRGLAYRRYLRAAYVAARANATRRATVSGNKVSGGTSAQRLVALAYAALEDGQSGRRPARYSQAGKWTVAYPVTGEPSGYRSDCSQWVTSLYHAAGLPDPNGTGYKGGYTGSLADHCKRVAVARAGTLVIWDPWGPKGHVEIAVNSKGSTIGHGSAPIHAHTISEMNAYKGLAAHYYELP